MVLIWSVAAAFAIDPIQNGPVGPLEQVRDGFTSFFLLDLGDGTWAAFDAGVTPFKLRAALAGVGATPADVSHVFLTHGHSDHLAGLSSLPNARVHALADELPLLASEGVTPTDVHVDGDLIQAGAYTVETFAVPGHTAGTAAWLVGGVLVLGDTMVVSAGRPDALPAFFHDDVAENEASLLALRAELAQRAPGTVTALAPAHSDWVAVP